MIYLKDILKNQWKNCILVLAYIAIALVVYITLAVTVIKLWYVTLIISVAIVAIGLTIGILYIKSEYRRSIENVSDKAE